jgi:hypothetical protein
MALRYWFGAILVVLGVGLLADQLYPALAIGYWISTFWPLAVIALGAIVLATRSYAWIGGIILLFVGILLQIAALGIAGENAWGLIGPGLLILLGVLVIFRLGRPAVSAGKSEDLIHPFVIFSGYQIRPQVSNFRGGSATAMFGGLSVDLRGSKLAPEGARLEVTAAFGGANVIIPQDWQVDIDGIPLLGGWSNKAVSQASAGPVLTIRCLAMFGGIEIKNQP